MLTTNCTHDNSSLYTLTHYKHQSQIHNTKTDHKFASKMGKNINLQQNNDITHRSYTEEDDPYYFKKKRRKISMQKISKLFEKNRSYCI